MEHFVSWSISGRGSVVIPLLTQGYFKVSNEELTKFEGRISNSHNRLYYPPDCIRCVSMYTTLSLKSYLTPYLGHHTLQKENMSQKDTKVASTNASREMIIQKMARDYNAMKAAKDALEQQNNELLGNDSINHLKVV